MPHLFEIESLVMLALTLVLLGVKIFALVSALTFTPDHYRAADKLTKPAWVAILGLAVVANVVLGSPLNLLNIAFTIAALVFLADVRPALSSLTRR